MNRRRFGTLLGGLVTSGVFVSPRPEATTQTTRDSDHPYFPDAVFAQMVLSTNIQQATLFTEPLTMIFTSYGFPDEETATAVFPVAIEHYRARADAGGLDSPLGYDEVGVGPLGDERWAYYEVGENDRGRDFRVAVRVGRNLLFVISFALGGDTVEFVSEYLEGFLASATDDPESLLPEISDLPVGWEFSNFESGGDVLDQVTDPAAASTPVPATPDDSRPRS